VQLIITHCQLLIEIVAYKYKSNIFVSAKYRAIFIPQKVKIVCIRERKKSGDARVLFTPTQLAHIAQTYPEHQFAVESSSIRCFKDQEYKDLGIPVINDLHDADILLGIKEVPSAHLIPGKTYFFFSHTTKMQPHNKGYLQELVDKKISFYDYENFTNTQGRRLVSFGVDAGIIGAYQGLRTYGLQNNLFQLPYPNAQDTVEQLLQHINHIKLPHLKIVVTGNGNVGKGVQSFLKSVGVLQVKPQDFLEQQFNTPVFTQLSKEDYLYSENEGNFCESDFFNHPQHYQSDFVKFAQTADLFINGLSHTPWMPLLFTNNDISNPKFKINTIADISCDVNEPIPTCVRASTISDPVYGYHKKWHQECDFKTTDSIGIMAIDNLPCQLPKMTSTHFGTQFMEQVLPYLLSDLQHPVLQKAHVLAHGEFTNTYAYLNDFLHKETLVSY